MGQNHGECLLNGLGSRSRGFAPGTGANKKKHGYLTESGIYIPGSGFLVVLWPGDLYTARHWGRVWGLICDPGYVSILKLQLRSWSSMQSSLQHRCKLKVR